MEEKSNIELAREYLDETDRKMSYYAKAADRKIQWVYDLLRGKATPSIKEAIALEKATKGLLKVKNW